MKIQIKRIAPSSLAGTLGAIYFIIGCATTVLGFLVSTTGAHMTFNSWINISGAGHLSTLMLLFNPFIAGVSGWISGLLIAWIYNFISRYAGGVVIEIEETGYFI